MFFFHVLMSSFCVLSCQPVELCNCGMFVVVVVMLSVNALRSGCVCVDVGNCLLHVCVCRMRAGKIFSHLSSSYPSGLLCPQFWNMVSH